MIRVLAVLIISTLFIENASFASVPAMGLARDRPKMRVAVARFGATDRFASVYGGWDIGGGLAAQLVTELIGSGRVVVVERAILSKVLMEQELGESRLLTQMTKAPAGHLLGVDYLIVGEVTEFEERQMGAGMAAGFLGARVSGEVNAAHVGIDMRLVDTRTGEILYSHRAQGKAWEKAAGGRINYKILDFGGEAFHKTPLGVATRRAIDNAVGFILNVIDRQVENYSWLGLVIESEAGMVYFNSGSDKGVNVGDRFRISTIKKVLTDPESNQMIGLIENELGYAVAVTVDRRYTRAKLLGGFAPRQGDIVRFAERSKDKMNEHNIEPAGYDVME